jgi:hypothetical protein
MYTMNVTEDIKITSALKEKINKLQVGVAEKETALKADKKLLASLEESLALLEGRPTSLIDVLSIPTKRVPPGVMIPPAYDQCGTWREKILYVLREMGPSVVEEIAQDILNRDGKGDLKATKKAVSFYCSVMKKKHILLHKDEGYAYRYTLANLNE